MDFQPLCGKARGSTVSWSPHKRPATTGLFRGADNRWYCERTCAHNKSFDPTGHPTRAPVERDCPAASPRAEATRQKSMSADPIPAVTALASSWRDCHARETLKRLLLDGFPHAKCFEDVIEPVIAKALTQFPRVIAFRCGSRFRSPLHQTVDPNALEPLLQQLTTGI
jgi:hypothetical protein